MAALKTWIALFRGINVGGSNILRMAELRSDLEFLNLQNVRTYIQSGNAVFESAARNALSLASDIGDLIQKQHGFRPHLLVLDRDDLMAAIESNPFPEAVFSPKTLHFFFLSEPPVRPDRDAIDRAKSATESYELTDKVFYLHAPDGIGRSRLAAKVETYLGTVTTARNYRTVSRLLSMATQAD